MKELFLEDFSKPDGGSALIASLCQSDKIDISIAYTSEFTSAKALREIVDSICKSYNIDPKWRTRFVLIVDELNNNAIEYGSKKGDINYLKVSITSHKDGKFKVIVSVTDTGKGDQAKSSTDMEEMRNKHKTKDFSQHHSIRGRGLFLIISHLVDTLKFTDSQQGGLVVQVEKVL